jgi:formylglycine-generating enzyme
MVPPEYAYLLAEFEPDGDAHLAFEIARGLEERGLLEGAATLYDRTYGLDPDNSDIIDARAALLDRLSVTEHGLVFRYVPGGVFLMGDHNGEPDERPWHPVWLEPFWLTDTPVSWADWNRLMGWPTPAEDRWWERMPDDDNQFMHGVAAKLRDGYSVEPSPYRDRKRWTEVEDRYDSKPAVAVSWDEAMAIGARLSTGTVRYGLPTEAQWEKAARGGRIGSRHPWGDRPATQRNCDCEGFTAIELQPSKTYPPNGYGLYAMCGGVWEWTADWYDRDFYADSPAQDPTGPADGKEKVLRGGSWADCRDVCTVSYRMSRRIDNRERYVRHHLTPTIGFRLCRTRAKASGAA